MVKFSRRTLLTYYSARRWKDDALKSNFAPGSQMPLGGPDCNHCHIETRPMCSWETGRAIVKIPRLVYNSIIFFHLCSCELRDVFCSKTICMDHHFRCTLSRVCIKFPYSLYFMFCLFVESTGKIYIHSSPGNYSCGSWWSIVDVTFQMLHVHLDIRAGDPKLSHHICLLYLYINVKHIWNQSYSRELNRSMDIAKCYIYCIQRRFVATCLAMVSSLKLQLHD